MEEIELVKGIKKNKTLYNYFGKFKYFKFFETDKALESLLKQKPVFNKCRKNKPLSYIRDNCLFIDDTVKNNNYSDDLEVCRFAPGIRDQGVPSRMTALFSESSKTSPVVCR